MANLFENSFGYRKEVVEKFNNLSGINLLFFSLFDEFNTVSNDVSTRTCPAGESNTG